MKLPYLFVDQNNGHYKSYYPFTSSYVITQLRADELQEDIPGAHRTGVSFYAFAEYLGNAGIDVEQFQCPCCNILLTELALPKIDYSSIFTPDYSKRDAALANWRLCYGIDWTLLEGISGNY